jgi:hypothetical protein
MMATRKIERVKSLHDTSEDDPAKAVSLRRLERTATSDLAEWRTRQTFYVKSLRLTVEELHVVVDPWRKEKEFDFVDTWNGFIAKNQLQDNDAVWVRYVGTTNRDGYTRSPEGPTGQKYGLYHSFVAAVENRLPDVSRNWAVHELVRASIPCLTPPQFVEDIERLFIARLGYDNRGLWN